MRLADRVFLTSDNPRSEDPQRIIDQIAQSAAGAEQCAERAAAIRQAVVRAGENDVVLIAGKGHEEYQDIAGVKHPFSDFQVAEAALARWSPAHD